MLSDQALHENQSLFHSVAGLTNTPWFHGLKARNEDKSFWLFEEKGTLSPKVPNISGIHEKTGWRKSNIAIICQ